jgi:hypothetical protein
MPEKLRSRRGDEAADGKNCQILCGLERTDPPRRAATAVAARRPSNGRISWRHALRLPFQKVVGKFGEEPGRFAHWREGLLGFLHLPMGVATGLIEAQKFRERYFVM